MSAAIARKFVANVDILLARDMHANTEIGDVGSPDSGYSTNSPRSLANENSQLAVDVTAPKRKPSTSDGQKQVHRISGGTSREQAPASDNKVTSVGADKAVPSCHRQQKAAHKRRSLKRSCAEDDVHSSPVLGIKILPEPTSSERSALEVERKQSSGNSQSFNGERSSSDRMGTRFEGAFTCRLCSKNHENALLLAQHQCPRIVNVRYECSECGKSFGCPANLASHKRWHKPKEPSSQQPAAMNSQTDLKRRRMSPAPMLASHKSEAAASLHKAGQHFTAIAEPSEGRSTPSQGKVRKAIHPCPGCKRRFRRESNRRKHALVKHGIVIAADTPSPNAVSSTPPSPPLADCDKAPLNTDPVSTRDTNNFVHCNLTTLALAAEALNRNITAGMTGKATSPACDVKPSRAADLGKPLDLSTTSGGSKPPLRHGVDQILNLSLGVKAAVKVPTVPSAASKDVSGFAPQWPCLTPAYALKNVQALNNCYGWPFAPTGNAPTSLFADYRYLAAMAAERMLSCQYRM